MISPITSIRLINLDRITCSDLDRDKALADVVFATVDNPDKSRTTKVSFMMLYNDTRLEFYQIRLPELIKRGLIEIVGEI